MFQKDIAYNTLPPLPPAVDLESATVLKKAIRANSALAELRGWSYNQSNPLLLLQALALQEAKTSSEIENVVTTNDELYQALADAEDVHTSPSAKEVLHYKEALWHGFQMLQDGYPLTINLFTELFHIVKQRSDGIRAVPGTVLKNAYGDIVYTPPNNREVILDLLSNLERYIHDNNGVDPLIKLAVMHYQFECIHPFPDGNGRVGRILNVLYLIHEKLLSHPILYLSAYVIQNKGDYYRALQGVTERGDWETWILYILDAVEVTSTKTLRMIQAIHAAQEQMMAQVKDEAPEIYSKEFVELLFEQPYCKISFLEHRGIAKRQTATKYLNKLSELHLLTPVQRGRTKYYINRALWDILVQR